VSSQLRVRRTRRGMIPLRVMIVLFVAMIALLAWWTFQETRPTTGDGRTEIVAWGITFFGDEIYTLIHQFEHRSRINGVVLLEDHRAGHKFGARLREPVLHLQRLRIQRDDCVGSHGASHLCSHLQLTKYFGSAW